MLIHNTTPVAARLTHVSLLVVVPFRFESYID